MLFASFTCWKLHKGAIKDKGTILNAGKVNVKRWYKIIKACIVKNRSGNFLDQSENWGLAKALSLHQWIEYESRFPKMYIVLLVKNVLHNKHHIMKSHFGKQHLPWGSVTFFGDFRHLSWAYFLCYWAEILICWCQSLRE